MEWGMKSMRILSGGRYQVGRLARAAGCCVDIQPQLVSIHIRLCSCSAGFLGPQKGSPQAYLRA